MELFGQHIAISGAIFLFLALLLALSFEFVNGFHDTANAVATVIYTHSLKPVPAVVWSGCWNLIGVLTSSGAVAFTIVALLPVELVLDVGSKAAFAMVFALLISAIIWNLGTWYLGLPASSSHTLIGSIMGVGLANAMMSGHPAIQGINWTAVKGVFAALIFSPVLGFVASALLLLVGKALIKRPDLFTPPEKHVVPPLWIRGLLIFTCTGVSFAHGSNDGQKGMGLLMLILIGILPGAFALQLGTSAKSISSIVAQSRQVSALMQAHDPNVTLSHDAANADLSAFLKSTGKASDETFAAVAAESKDIVAHIGAKQNLQDLSNADRSIVRRDMYMVSGSIGKLSQKHKIAGKAEEKSATAYAKSLDKVTMFIPLWIKILVAFALGLGTMIGWQRIVVTVGEKIGKAHLTYAQGASAEFVAMATIGLATSFGLPVSTTHVLSSGIAGTMAANGSGLQKATLRNIILAWVLTLPVCVLLGALIFAGTIYVALHGIGVH